MQVVKNRLAQVGTDKVLYLKVMVRDTCLRPHPIEAVETLQDDDPVLFHEIYFFDPIGTSDFGVLLMNDCGVPLDEADAIVNSWGVSDFFSLFTTLWDKTMALTETVFHGDALPHNLVYNQELGKIVLLDIDEGRCEPNNAPQRVLEEASDEPFASLQYPNVYRIWDNRKVYTQLQLIDSFLVMIEPLEHKLNGEDMAQLRLLRNSAEAANRYCKANDKLPPSVENDVPLQVTTVISNMTEFLKKDK